MDSFGFGPVFTKWIKVIYTDITATVLNNGFSTEFFNIRRGIRQGCPVSAYLFILAVELLAIEIRSNDNIKGITIQNSEIKIIIAFLWFKRGFCLQTAAFKSKYL